MTWSSSRSNQLVRLKGFDINKQINYLIHKFALLLRQRECIQHFLFPSRPISERFPRVQLHYLYARKSYTKKINKRARNKWLFVIKKINNSDFEVHPVYNVERTKSRVFDLFFFRHNTTRNVNYYTILFYIIIVIFPIDFLRIDLHTRTSIGANTLSLVLFFIFYRRLFYYACGSSAGESRDYIMLIIGVLSARTLNDRTMRNRIAVGERRR